MQSSHGDDLSSAPSVASSSDDTSTYTAIPQPADGRLLCLTYNVCFGCMSDDPNVSALDLTAQPLAGACSRSAGECLRRVASLIGCDEPDLVFLQEAENIDALMASDPWLTNLRCDKCISGFETMATLSNPRRFETLATANGEVTPGRPLLLVLMREIDTGRTVLAVNLHNDPDRSWMSPSALSARLSSLFDSTNASDLRHALFDLTTRTVVAPDLCVVGGDFNSESFFDGFWPFAYSKHDAIASIFAFANTGNQLLGKTHTCCDPTAVWADKDHDESRMYMRADYIASDATMMHHNEVSAHAGGLTSDHIMVVATVSPDWSVKARLPPRISASGTRRRERELIPTSSSELARNLWAFMSSWHIFSERTGIPQACPYGTIWAPYYALNGTTLLTPELCDALQPPADERNLALRVVMTDDPPLRGDVNRRDKRTPTPFVVHRICDTLNSTLAMFRYRSAYMSPPIAANTACLREMIARESGERFDLYGVDESVDVERLSLPSDDALGLSRRTYRISLGIDLRRIHLVDVIVLENAWGQEGRLLRHAPASMEFDTERADDVAIAAMMQELVAKRDMRKLSKSEKVAMWLMSPRSSDGIAPVSLPSRSSPERASRQTSSSVVPRTRASRTHPQVSSVSQAYLGLRSSAMDARAFSFPLRDGMLDRLTESSPEQTITLLERLHGNVYKHDMHKVDALCTLLYTQTSADMTGARLMAMLDGPFGGMMLTRSLTAVYPWHKDGMPLREMMLLRDDAEDASITGHEFDPIALNSPKTIGQFEEHLDRLITRVGRLQPIPVPVIAYRGQVVVDATAFTAQKPPFDFVIPTHQSFTVDVGIANRFIYGHGMLMRVRIPQGFRNAYYIGERTTTMNEYEVLVKRGCVVRVEAVYTFVLGDTVSRTRGAAKKPSLVPRGLIVFGTLRGPNDSGVAAAPSPGNAPASAIAPSPPVLVTRATQTGGMSGGLGKRSWLSMFPGLGLGCGTYLAPGSHLCEDGRTPRNLRPHQPLPKEEEAILRAQTAETRYAKPRTEEEKAADPDDTAWMRIDDGVNKHYGKPRNSRDRWMDWAHGIHGYAHTFSPVAQMQRHDRAVAAAKELGIFNEEFLDTPIEDKERAVYGYHITPMVGDPRR